MKLKKRYSIPLALVLLTVIAYAFISYKPKHYTMSDSKGNNYTIERGSIAVPELRTDKNSRSIQIDFAKIKSFSSSPKTPIFYLAGGPGQGATGQAENGNALYYWSAFLEDRDVILIDQRGVNKLHMWYAQLKWPQDDLFVSEDAASKHLEGITQKALKAFERRGINLNGYNSVESAQDIDEVRDALGYEKIIPMGFSYGTHLGQVYLKQYEDRVERAILIGVEGLDETFKMPMDLDNQLDKLNELIQVDSLLAASIPDLKILYQRVSKKLSEQPIELRIATPIKLKKTIRFGKFGLDFIFKRDLGDANDIPHLIKLLHEMDQGEYEGLRYYAQKRYKEFLAIPAMTFSMDLASGGSEERLQEIAKQEQESIFGKVNNFPFLDLHGVWPITDLGTDFRKPLSTDVPVLLLSGSLDINTPAYQADRLAKHLPNSTHLVVKNAGHEQIKNLWDTMKTMIAFMNGEDVSGVVLEYGRFDVAGGF